MHKSNSFLKIPKANFHLHLTGSLDASSLRELAKLCKLDLSALEPLDNKYSFNDEAIWMIAKQVTSCPEGLRSALMYIVDNERKDAVTYLELTLNPFGMIRRGMTKEDIASALFDAATYAYSKQMTLKFKLGINRKDGPSSCEIVADVFNACDESLRSHIDLNGDEKKFRLTDFVPRLASLSNGGIPLVLHVGETAPVSMDEILTCGPSRLAHALKLDQEGYKTIAERNIDIEVSLLSNKRTGAFVGQGHPVRLMVDAGVRILLGTDDPAFFDSSMSDEFQELTRVGFTEEEVLQMNMDIMSRFV